MKHDVAELFRCAQAALGGDGIDELLAAGRRLLADLAGGVLLVLRGDGIGDFRRGDPKLGHAVRFEPDAHRVVEGAEDLCVADAGNALQVVQDIDQRIVGEVERCQAVVGRGQRRHQQNFARTLGDRDAVLADHVGQARLRDLDPVVDVHRRHIDVRSDFKRGGDGQRAVGGRRGVEVKQVLDPGKLLLDRRSDRLGQGFGRSAGIGCGNDHRRRGDVGVLGDRQTERRQKPGDHDDDRDH